jgi:hypothetical protein
LSKIGRTFNGKITTADILYLCSGSREADKDNSRLVGSTVGQLPGKGLHEQGFATAKARIEDHLERPVQEHTQLVRVPKDHSLEAAQVTCVAVGGGR